MPRGGKREGAGRKSSGKPTTKATIYLEDRTLLNSFAKSFGLPVNEFLHYILNHPQFSHFLDDIKRYPSGDKM